MRFVDVGLKLSVIPTINDDGMITMKLTPEISEVVKQITSSEGSTIPQVNKTEVETSVMVKDGQTIVMAGLRDQNKVHTKLGIPGLMDIPFIGGAFQPYFRYADQYGNRHIDHAPYCQRHDDYEKVIGTIKGPKTYNDSIQPNSLLHRRALYPNNS